jgi:hypothetical protein
MASYALRPAVSPHYDPVDDSLGYLYYRSHHYSIVNRAFPFKHQPELYQSHDQPTSGTE